MKATFHEAAGLSAVLLALCLAIPAPLSAVPSQKAPANPQRLAVGLDPTMPPFFDASPLSSPLMTIASSHLFAEAVEGNVVAAAVASEKVSSLLRAVIAELLARGITRQNARERGASELSNALVRVNEDGAIQTYIYVSALGPVEIEELERMEAVIEIANEELGIVQAWIPFDRIDEVAQLPFVSRITSPSYAAPRAGSVTTEGDAILGSDLLRALGVDGSGVKVGVISDGVRGRAAAQATGDLPPGITVFGACTRRPFSGSACDSGNDCNEGTALLEIVHDIAPGAELGFGAASTSLEFIQRIDDLVNAFGADVIVDDLGFFTAPYFEDGPIAKAVAAVKDRVVYVSAAGNHALRHYEAAYLETIADAFSDHDFGRAAARAGDPSMNVRIGPGQLVGIVLQWNDRFSASGNDYDLFLFDETETTVLALSIDAQEGSDDPIEFACYFNDTGSPVTGKVVVTKFSGQARRLELFLLGGVTILEYGVRAGSVFGHAAVPGILAVGAVGAGDPGHDDIEPFSSRGPSKIFFPAQQTRMKPDIVAIDGVSVTGSGGFPSLFFGTSAAAPHVAGIAALLKEKVPAAAPFQIVQALRDSAIDLGSVGPDNIFGAGLVDALAAAQQLRADGIWVRKNDSAWVKLHKRSAKTMVTGDVDGNGKDEVIVDFGQTSPLKGIWVRRNDRRWRQLHELSASGIVTGDMDGSGLDEVIVDFGQTGSPTGIWVRKNDSIWVQLHKRSGLIMAIGDMDGTGKDEVIVDFGQTGNLTGIWVRRNDRKWVQLHKRSGRMMVTGDVDDTGKDEVIVDFGQTGNLTGIWVRRNDRKWRQLHSSSAVGMVTGDMDGNGLDEVIIDFGQTGGPTGIWVRRNDSTWVQLHKRSGASMVTGDVAGTGKDEVIVDFGQTGNLRGIWVRRNDRKWRQLHQLSPRGMVTGDMDGTGKDEVIIDFGL